MRTVAVALRAEVAGYIANLRTAAGATRDLGRELEAAAKADKLDNLARNMAIVGTGLVAVAGYAVKLSMEFEAGMSKAAAATNATGKELEQLRDAALEAGKATKYSATEAAGAITELGKAGVSTKDILNGGLNGALALAAAGEMKVGDAAEIAATALTMFKLSGKDIPHIADLLAAGANEARGEVHDLGMALNQGGLVASQFGISVEDTVATLTSFAAAGLVGSDSGTSFKTMLMMLANPTKASTTLMQDLGIKTYDASGKFVGIRDLAEQLRSKLGGLTQAQRNHALSVIFGADAIRAASILYEQGGKGIDDFAKKTNVAGSAADTAAKKADNLKGDLEKLRGSLETVAIEAGSGTNNGLRVLTQTVQGAVDAFGHLDPAVQTGIVVLTAMAGAGLLASAGFIKVKQTSAELVETVAGMGPTGEKAAKGLEKFMGYAGKAGAIGVAAVIAYEGLSMLGDWINSQAEPAARNLDGMTQSIKEFGTKGQASGELAKAFGKDLRGLGKDIDSIIKYNKAMEGANASLRRAVETNDLGTKSTQKLQAMFQGSRQGATDIAALDKALAGMASAGGAGQASVAFERIARGANLSSEEIARLKSLMPEFATATQGAALANTGLASGFGDAATNAGTLASGLEMAIADGKSMIDIWNQLNGAVASSDDSMLKALESVDKVSASFQANGTALDRNTVAGLRNRVAIETTTQLAAKAATEKYKETGSVEAANAAYEAGIAPLREVLKQYKFTDDAIQDIIDTMGNMPDFKNIPVNTPGAAQAKTEVDLLNEEIANLKGKQVEIKQSGVENAEYQIAELQRKINALQGRTVQINTQIYEQRTYSSTQEFRETRGQRWGGITEHARSGLLKDARVFSGGPTRYAFAEAETGGEAFVPRKGNYGRSMDILNKAAGWYGAQVMPAGGGGGVNNYTISVNASVAADLGKIGGDIVEAIVTYEQTNGARWRRNT